MSCEYDASDNLIGCCAKVSTGKDLIWAKINTVGCCEQAAPPELTLKEKYLQEKRERRRKKVAYQQGTKTMYDYISLSQDNGAAVDPVLVSKNYLLDRMSSIYTQKDTKAHYTFGLLEEAPTTIEEALKRIKDGEYKLLPDNRGYYRLWDRLSWATVDMDKAGYTEFQKELDKKYYATKDIIMTKSLDDGLKAMQDFEANA